MGSSCCRISRGVFHRMRFVYRLYCALFFGSCVTSISCRPRAEKPSTVIVVTTGQSIRIPIRLVTPSQPSVSTRTELVVNSGSEDDLPEGPQGFDVRPDGGFVLTDPLQDRLVFYSARGDFTGELAIGFAADLVHILDSEHLAVRRAATGDYYTVNRQGTVLPIRATEAEIPETSYARLISSQTGQIMDDRINNGGVLKVEFNVHDRQMVSLRTIPSSDHDWIYVAIETAGSGQTIQVRTVLRKYDLGGTVVSEINDASPQLYWTPSIEFRISHGIVYQMVPSSADIIINVWDTNIPK
jgi:hypothetical protein